MDGVVGCEREMWVEEMDVRKGRRTMVGRGDRDRDRDWRRNRARLVEWVDRLW